MSDNKALDILGIKPIGDAINTTVTKSFEGIEGFLKLVCAPALEEIGLLFKDKVRHWRLNNILNILHKAQGKLDFTDDKLHIKAHPKVAISILENGSLNDNDEVQELWAGLFVASCTQDGQDDENLIFVDLLKQLTVVEARIFKYSCEGARKILYPNGLMIADTFSISCDVLTDLTSIKDIHRLDRELDHLHSLNLIGSSLNGAGFDENLNANIKPTALALNLYVRTQGFHNDPAKFWKSGVITKDELLKESEQKQAEEEEKQRLQIEKRMQEQQAQIEKEESTDSQ
jgi:hypothetical protein